MTAKINAGVGLKVVATTYSGNPYRADTPIEDISAIAVVNAVYEPNKPRFAVCIRRKLLDEQFVYANNQWTKVRGVIPSPRVDDLPDYTAYGLPVAPLAAATIYETAVVLSVGGPGTHEILTPRGWEPQPGGLIFTRELRINREVIKSNPNAIEHARRALETIKHLEPFVYFGDPGTSTSDNVLKHCLHCGWGFKCGCPAG